jgi:hypothetical protein
MPTQALTFAHLVDVLPAVVMLLCILMIVGGVAAWVFGSIARFGGGDVIESPDPTCFRHGSKEQFEHQLRSGDALAHGRRDPQRTPIVGEAISGWRRGRA